MITWTDIRCGQYLEGVVPAGRESSRNHRSRALLILSLTLALALGMAGVPESAAAAPTLKVAPATPIAGESFTVSATLSTKVARTVVLQKKTSGKWRTVKKGKSSAAGKVSLTSSTKLTSITLGVLAPKTRIKHRTHKKITSRTITVRTTKQTISLKLPTGTYVNKAVTANVIAKPARPGRRVQLQLLSDGKWKTIATATQNTAGNAALSLAAPEAGTFTYRAVAVAHAGAPAINSTGRNIEIQHDPTTFTGPETAGRVGSATSAVLIGDSWNVSSAEWVTQLPGATISTPEATTPLEVRFTPPVPGTYPYRVKVRFTDGSTQEFDGKFKGIAIPPRSIRVRDIQTTYAPANDPCCESDSHLVTFQLERTSTSDSEPFRDFYSREDPATDSFSYLSGDSNSNSKLDSGEIWTYQGQLFWLDTGESDTHRTRTIEIYANDDTGAQPWVETEAVFTVTR